MDGEDALELEPFIQSPILAATKAAIVGVPASLEYEAVLWIPNDPKYQVLRPNTLTRVSSPVEILLLQRREEDLARPGSRTATV